MTAVHPYPPAYLLERPGVLFTTLGGFEAYVNARPAVWESGGTGTWQLRRSVAFLIARRGRYVRESQLMAAAGGHHASTRSHVWNGLVRLLTGWKMGGALKRLRRALMLQRHPSWHTDFDALEQLKAQAGAASAAGDAALAVELLEKAAVLCRGEFLPIFDDPAHQLVGEGGHWLNVQKKVLCALVRAHWQLPGEDHQDRALSVAGLALEFDSASPPLYRLAEEAARRASNMELAQRYADRARQLEQ
ncbi:MAG TPA: hypothetical protein VNL77_14305 [Roseiflexaceae bacterium]|nr:hypothetical protein [Roseiflexaceae bacterium]